MLSITKGEPGAAEALSTDALGFCVPSLANAFVSCCVSSVCGITMVAPGSRKRGFGTTIMLRERTRITERIAQPVKYVPSDLHILVERICPIRKHVIGMVVGRMAHRSEHLAFEGVLRDLF